MIDGIYNDDDCVIMNNDIKEKTYYVENLYFCINDRDEVGIYKRIKYYNKNIRTLFNKNYYNSGLIFSGVDNDNVCIIQTHYESNNSVSALPVGSRVSDEFNYYTANCKIVNYISFNNLCLKMYDEGLIKNYSMDKVKEKDLLKIIKYAYDYFFDKLEVKKSTSKKLTKSKDE